MSKMKHGSTKHMGSVKSREGGYKAKGNKSPKTARKHSHNMPTSSLGNNGRKGVSNSTVKNYA